jgi:predicted molibdopterin-dependent oxidoreductase YjgC
MLVDGAGDVVLLPAATRYESEGGGTETTTERRIVFSPEIPGRRIGSARPEWRAFTDVISRVHPERAAQIGFESAAAIRSEIARAVPMYRGIETLAAKGDQIQWGGRTLFADGRFATPDGKARFSVVRLKPDTTDEDAVPDEHATVASGVSRTFRLSTRRGKQFNSMIQREIDPLTGASRDAVFISPDDLARLNFADGDRVRLQSPHGCYSGRLKSAPMTPGNLEVHWPEGNVLLSATAIDRESMEPDYNTTVTIAAAAGIADTST